MKIIDADKLHYKTVRIATQKGIKPALVVFAKEIQKMPEILKHGHWKEHKDYPGLAYLCSDCGYFTTDRSYYCPNCGAYMGEMK